MDYKNGKESEEPLSKLLTLPTELLIYIITFLTCARDMVKLRYVSRRVRSICETPLLWRKFIWPYFDTREERCVFSAFKSCGRYIRQLSFPDHPDHMTIDPHKLTAMVRQCSNLVDLRVSTSKLSSDQLGNVIKSMGNLQVLDILWTGQIHSLLVICNGLKELSIRMNSVDMDKALYDWTINGLLPKTVNIFCDHHYSITALTQQWSSLVNHTLLGTAHDMRYFKVYRYRKIPMDLSLPLPSFQLQFGQSCTLPFVAPGKFGLLGLEDYLLLLTDYTNIYDGKTLYKARAMLNYEFGRSIIQDSGPNSCLNSTVNSTFITHFNGSYCQLHSGHLEQLAMACPNLLELNLEKNVNCLKRLQGLRTIATCCQYLRGLNLLFISANDLESCIQLWEILVELKLTYLAIDSCALLPHEIDDQTMKTIVSLYQECSDLKALEFDYCDDCKHAGDHGDCQLLSNFPSLVHLSANTFTHPTAMRDIVSSCTQLRFFIYSSSISFDLSGFSNCNLVELDFDFLSVDISDSFMESISSHGGLVHVVMRVKSVTSDGIVALIGSSPKLMIFHISAKCVNASTDVPLKKLRGFKAALKKEFYNRKLFSCGSYRLTINRRGEVINCSLMILNNTELTSLW